MFSPVERLSRVFSGRSVRQTDRQTLWQLALSELMSLLEILN